jgi:hypothetical protein
MIRRMTTVGAVLAMAVGGVTAGAVPPAAAASCTVFQYLVIAVSDATDAPSGGNVKFQVVPEDIVHVDNRSHQRYGGQIYGWGVYPLGYGWVLPSVLRYTGRCW